MSDRERFDALCRADMESLHFREGIGTYSEKRLHRILKSYITENKEAYEVSIGRYVADVFEDGHITEIQTRSFDKLLPKLKYYLTETEYSVTVVCPIIRNKMLFRIDPETGEILRKKTSPSHGRTDDVLACLYHIREVIPNERLTVKVMLIDAEEYRYSERVRYRREGAYESELFPTSLVEERELSEISDFLEFLPENMYEFSVAEYSELIGRKGRAVYSRLNFLYSVGLLERRKDGKKYIYKKRDA